MPAQDTPGTARPSAAPQPDDRPLPPRRIVVAECEQVGERTAQGGQQRQKIAGRVAPQYRFGCRFRARVMIRGGAQRGDQSLQRRAYAARSRFVDARMRRTDEWPPGRIKSRQRG